MPRVPCSPEGLRPPGGHFSHSVRNGNVVWASGQGGQDPETGELVGDDVGSQTRQTLENLKAALAASGAGLDDVVRVGVFITTPDDFAAMNEAYASFWGEGPPARTTVSVGLPGNMKVEIDAVAVIDG
ncbi:MAG: Rid family hydrolase [Nitriliruptoraceae bacterium]